jgi:hypothetical protein
MGRINSENNDSSMESKWISRPLGHLKRQELGGYVFEDEYDLAITIIEETENRGQLGDYAVERLMFN